VSQSGTRYVYWLRRKRGLFVLEVGKETDSRGYFGVANSMPVSYGRADACHLSRLVCAGRLRQISKCLGQEGNRGGAAVLLRGIVSFYSQKMGRTIA
jgi:hypothetical protein